jgi:multidrug efflux pump subunit AcrA (membrane-fusion protein)
MLFLILCGALTLIGMAGGWFAAHQKLGGSAATQDAQALDTGQDSQAQDPAGVHLSPQTLRNLGVTVATVELTTFFKHRDIPAVVRSTPVTYQPVFAPIGGRVKEIWAEFGSVVEGDEVMVTLIRDALPRPQLTLTEEVLKPATEEFHQTIGKLRTALCGLEILQTEMERLETFNMEGADDGLPIIPRKDLIELRYDFSRAEQELANLRTELRLHGMSDEEISKTEKGKEARISLHFWHNALIRNGLWPELAERIYKALPETVRDLPWTVATISELVAGGLADADLAEWFEKEPATGRYFLAIGGLLQAGSSPAEVRTLYELGALAPIVEIRAPRTAPDWDVNELFIKPGERVEAGSKLMTLANPRQMFLRVESVGGETATLLSALEGDTELEARPLVSDTGPRLKGLKILNLVNEESSEGTVAYIPLANEPFKTIDRDGGDSFRSWNLRGGLRYMLRIPVENEKWADVFVLPSDAVTDDGPNKVVFIQNGDVFMPQKVVLLYLDQEVAVLGKGSELFPGDMVAHHGAFGLGLAMKATDDPVVDEHAGHNH